MLCAGWLGCASVETVDWVGRPPPGCAVGSSGPTRNPGDAIRKARRNALHHLGNALLGVRVTSELYLSDDAGEVTRQSLRGLLKEARIHALWAEHEAIGDRVWVREVHALACEPGATPDALPARHYPDWVLQAPREPGRVCALGVGGPTRRASHQGSVTLADGQRALAEALESRIEGELFDSGRGLSHVSARIEPSPRSLERATSVEDLAQRWRDDPGRGPLGLRGVLYGLVCLEEG